MYRQADIGLGIDKVLIQLRQGLVYLHAGIHVDGHVGIGKLERMVADVVKDTYRIVDVRKARVFRNVVDIPCLAFQLLAVRYHQVMDIAAGILHFPDQVISAEDTLDYSVLVHFTRRLDFLGRLTWLLCVCGTCQKPQKRL